MREITQILYFFIFNYLFLIPIDNNLMMEIIRDLPNESLEFNPHDLNEIAHNNELVIRITDNSYLIDKIKSLKAFLNNVNYEFIDENIDDSLNNDNE
jgi:hypothetical protein